VRVVERESDWRRDRREEDTMSDVPFYRTQMGHRYYEHTLPELVRQLARVGDLLERIATARGVADAPPREKMPDSSAPR
jgi:hypothetical protein